MTRRYEYRVEAIESVLMGGQFGIVAALNLLDAEGWELVCTFYDQHLILRRVVLPEA